MLTKDPTNSNKKVRNHHGRPRRPGIINFEIERFSREQAKGISDSLKASWWGLLRPLRELGGLKNGSS